jgi:iron complex transport system substrate-binding protein
MKNANRIGLFALVISMILGLVACAPNAPTTPAELTKIEITDVTGRKVTLEAPATKIVGTHNPSLNTAVVLGGGQKYLAGFGNKEMGRGLYTLVMNDFDGLTQIGMGKNINFETVAKTGANLAIIPERFKDQAEQFEKVGVPALIALPNTESFDTIKTALATVGKALGEDKRASEINAFLDKKIANAQTIAAKATTKPKVLFLGGSSPLSVAPSAMIQTQLIETAGGANAVSGVEGKGDFINVNIEQIVAWNPDVIWFPAYAKYSVDSLLKDPAWSSIEAVKNKKVYMFPSKLEPWDQPTAAVALGVSWGVYNLHPDLYPLENLMKDTDEFYKLVYGKTFTAEQQGLK